MKISIDQFPKKANLLRKNEVYTIYDLPLKNLVISMTILHPGKHTTGHSHPLTEEVYLFLKGEGKILLGELESKVRARDLVTIPKGTFHRVYNESKGDLVFLCIFEKYEGRGK